MNIVNYISKLPLTKASFTIDGIRLETEIPGYRTIEATGRDTMSQEIDELESKIVDGTYYKNRRIPSRDITVEFVLIRETKEDLHDAYNKLKGILYNHPNAQFVFNDENDLYYIGTVQSLESENVVLNNDSHGTFVIHCSDPFKYSIEEYTVDPNSDNEFVIDYDGYYRSFPIITADFAGDCGFIGFTDGNGTLQFGDPNELDKGFVETNRTENLLNIKKGLKIPGSTKSPSTIMQEFTRNDSALIPLGCIQNGALNTKLVIKKNVKTYDAKGKHAYTKDYNENVLYLDKTNQGTATSSAIWPGVGFKHELNPDSGGSKVAKNFLTVFDIVIDALKEGEPVQTSKVTDPTQVGMLQVVCATADKKPILGMVFLKNNQSTEVEVRAYAGTYELINERVSGATNKNLNCSADSYYNKYLFWDHGTFSMKKVGNKVDFYIDHKHHTLDANSVPAVKAIINEEMATVDFFIGRLDTTKRSGSARGYSYKRINELYVRGVAMEKYNATKLSDVPNKFIVGNSLEVNTGDGTILVDGVSRNELGAIGNEWDDLYLRPGTNVIKASYSSWASKPTLKLRYRKVFI